MEKLLEHLEKNIDIGHIEKARDHFVATIDKRPQKRAPITISYPKENPFKWHPYRETFYNMEKMLYNELRGCVYSCEIGDDKLPMVRANYGVGTLPMFFGAESVLIENQMPWVKHFDSIGDIKNLIKKGIPDLYNTPGSRVLETCAYYKDKMSAYRKVSKYIPIYHPDLQGPFDVAHLLMGNDIYYLMYDEPGLVHDLLGLVTDTYIAVMEKFKDICDDTYKSAYNFHWGILYGGCVSLRDDTAVNLSKEMYLEFVKPYDEKIMKRFGGVSVHFCGQANQWVYELAKNEGIRAMNYGFMDKYIFGKEHLDMLRSGGFELPILSYIIKNQDFATFDFDRYSTGISFAVSAASEADAQSLLDFYYS